MLLLQRDTRTDAGVDEQVVALLVVQRQAFEEPQVSLRDFLLQPAGNLGKIRAKRRAVKVNPVAEQGGQPAVVEPARGCFRVLHEVEHGLLMVAAQVDAFKTGRRGVDHAVDHRL